MTETLTTDILPVPFAVADAWVERVCRGITEVGSIQPIPIGARRRQLSSGSARFDLLIRKKTAGWFTLMAHVKDQTFLMTETNQADEGVRQLLTELARTFVGFLTALGATAHKDMPAISNVADQLILSLGNIVQPADPSEPPGPNAPIDAWLDWRDAQLQRGRSPHSVSYKKLAAQSRHSESQLKHAGARRRRTKNGS